MAIEVRPWPGQPGELGEGEDARLDLVIHITPATARDLPLPKPFKGAILASKPRAGEGRLKG